MMTSKIALKQLPPWEAPRYFGDYQILGRLGAGGMAEVFLARQTDLGASGVSAPRAPLVALKKMLPHLAHDRSFVSRFKREATIAARLNHPAIARMLRAGRVGSSRFIAMELVRGETLSRVLDRQRRTGRPMPSALVAWVGVAVASGLHWAHELDDENGRPLHIVHRDVSPQNVMLGYDGSVKLIDFGVAHWVDSATRTGSLAGKVRYFSPEQVRGASIDRRTDIYSLGVMLYEALLGETVFSGDTDLAVMQAILDSEPPELADAPPRLRAALRRAMSKDPADRFSSAKELARALIPETAVDDEETVGRQDAMLAAYVQNLFPDGMQRWSKIVDQAAAGISFEDDHTGSLERESMTVETVAVTMPGNPQPVPCADALAATLALPGIPGRVRQWRVHALAGIVGLMLVCLVSAVRRPSTTLPALSERSWASVSPTARAETPLSLAGVTPPVPDRSAIDPAPDRSTMDPVPAQASAPSDPPPPSGADSRRGHDLRAVRTVEPKRASHHASQSGKRHHRRSARGRHPDTVRSIADQLEPSPYAWSSR